MLHRKSHKFYTTEFVLAVIKNTIVDIEIIFYISKSFLYFLVIKKY